MCLVKNIYPFYANKNRACWYETVTMIKNNNNVVFLVLDLQPYRNRSVIIKMETHILI
jgi:hypothetical protein